MRARPERVPQLFGVADPQSVYSEYRHQQVVENATRTPPSQTNIAFSTAGDAATRTIPGNRVINQRRP